MVRHTAGCSGKTIESVETGFCGKPRKQPRAVACFQRLAGDSEPCLVWGGQGAHSAARRPAWDASPQTTPNSQCFSASVFQYFSFSAFQHFSISAFDSEPRNSRKTGYTNLNANGVVEQSPTLPRQGATLGERPKPMEPTSKRLRTGRLQGSPSRGNPGLGCGTRFGVPHG